MKKILFLLLFPFFIKAQTVTPVKTDSVSKNNPGISRTKEEAKQLIESLRERILKGEDFGGLAAQYSEDPGSAKKGGMLSPVKKGQTVPEFENTAYSVQIGVLSDVFETRYGFHFLQVMSREGENVLARHILVGFK